MFKTVSALTVALAAASSASALSLEVTSAPTTGLAGYSTYTLTLVGDGEFNAMNASFSGPLNQEVQGLSAQFQNDGLLVFFPALAATDSFFTFDRPNLLVSATESDTSLEAVFAFDSNRSAPFGLAQLVIADGDTVTATILGGVGDGANDVIFEGSVTEVIPEPASAALLALGGLAALRRRA
ncbi:MAG: PEP-CTERM sorting domain-containing protein [Phycisphaeraceae bacterium]